jgi:hypothetical protein
MKIENQTPESYAAMWGCGAAYDRAPNETGDGHKFYNFGSEANRMNPEFLEEFIPAIVRTIKGVRQRHTPDKNKNVAGLIRLLTLVRARLFMTARKLTTVDLT